MELVRLFDLWWPRLADSITYRILPSILSLVSQSTIASTAYYMELYQMNTLKRPSKSQDSST